MNDFTNRYNTALTPEHETEYLNWASANKRMRDVYDYDMRGAWSKGITADENSHFPDTYKKPNHPTFSNESMYNGQDGYQGGKWSSNGGIDTFTPTRSNLEFMSRAQLKEYLQGQNALLGEDKMADVVQQYLQSRGATPSAENASRVRQHYASNPDLLDRRANGLPGGLDDNSSVLDALLDKHVAESMPAGKVTVGEPEAIPPPSRTAPMVKGKGEVGGTVPVAIGKPGASRQAGYGEANGAPVQAAESQYSPSTDDVASGGIGEWLKALLGISAAVPAAENMVGRMPAGPQGALPPPQQRITSQVGPNVESVGQEMQTIDQRNQAGRTQQRAQVQADVDAENDAMMRKMEEDARVKRNQRGTQETVNAAKRAFGRR